MTLTARIGRNTAVQIGGEVLSKVGSAAFYLVMARELGLEGFGAFTFSLSLALLLTTLAGFGTDALVTRQVAQAEGGEYPLLWPAVTVKVVIGSVAVALAVLLAAVLGESGERVGAVGVLGAAAIVELVAKTAYATFQGLEDMRPVATALLLQRLTTAAVGIAALLVGADVLTVALIYLAGAVLALGWVSRRLAGAGVRPPRVVAFGPAAALARASFPIGLATLLGTILFRIDTTILGVMEGDASVGLYGAAYRLLETTLFVSYAFGAALLPALSRADRDSSPSAAELFGAGCKVIAISLVPLGLIFVLFAPPIVALLYGDAYAQSARALELLGGAATMYGLSYLAGGALIALGAERTVPWITGGVMVQNIVLDLVLIPRYSFNGAAAATSISEVTLALGMSVAVVRLTGPIDLPRVLAGPVAGGVVMLAIWLVAPTTLLVATLAGAAYLVVVVAVERSLFPEDLQRLTGAVRARRGGG